MHGFIAVPEGGWHHMHGVPLLFRLLDSMQLMGANADTGRQVGHQDIFSTIAEEGTQHHTEAVRRLQIVCRRWFRYGQRLESTGTGQFPCRGTDRTAEI